MSRLFLSTRGGPESSGEPTPQNQKTSPKKEGFYVKYSRWESNPHSEELDFESSASTSSATRAYLP